MPDTIDAPLSLGLFFDGWELFREPALAGAVAGALLGLLGVYVVLRRVVFLSAAISQAAGLGVALSFYASLHLGLAVSPLVGAAALTGLAVLPFVGAGTDGQHDRLLGVIWLVGAARTLAVGTRIVAEVSDIQDILFGTAVAEGGAPRRLRPAVAGGAGHRPAAPVVVAGLRGVVQPGRRPRPRPAGAAARRGAVRDAGAGRLADDLGALPAFAFSVLPAAATLAVAWRAPGARLAAALGALIGFGGFLVSFRYSLPVGPAQALVGGATVVALHAPGWALRSLRRRARLARLSDSPVVSDRCVGSQARQIRWGVDAEGIGGPGQHAHGQPGRGPGAAPDSPVISSGWRRGRRPSAGARPRGSRKPQVLPGGEPGWPGFGQAASRGHGMGREVQRVAAGVAGHLDGVRIEEGLDAGEGVIEARGGTPVDAGRSTSASSKGRIDARLVGLDVEHQRVIGRAERRLSATRSVPQAWGVVETKTSAPKARHAASTSAARRWPRPRGRSGWHGGRARRPTGRGVVRRRRPAPCPARRVEARRAGMTAGAGPHQIEHGGPHDSAGPAYPASRREVQGQLKMAPAARPGWHDRLGLPRREAGGALMTRGSKNMKRIGMLLLGAVLFAGCADGAADDDGDAGSGAGGAGGGAGGAGGGAGGAGGGAGGAGGGAGAGARGGEASLTVTEFNAGLAGARCAPSSSRVLPGRPAALHRRPAVLRGAHRFLRQQKGPSRASTPATRCSMAPAPPAVDQLRTVLAGVDCGTFNIDDPASLAGLQVCAQALAGQQGEGAPCGIDQGTARRSAAAAILPGAGRSASATPARSPPATARRATASRRTATRGCTAAPMTCATRSSPREQACDDDAACATRLPERHLCGPDLCSVGS
ncbi:MAG: metal ABC transporter permease [bacterium]